MCSPVYNMTLYNNKHHKTGADTGKRYFVQFSFYTKKKSLYKLAWEWLAVNWIFI